MDFADFQPALFAATVMNAFDRPWCIAGGWAIDLWLGRLTRAHSGVVVAVFRDDQIALRDFLHNWNFAIPVQHDGKSMLRALPRADRQMLMPPVHSLHGESAHSRRVMFALEERDSVDWLYRRDRRIRWPVDQWTVRGAFGVPALAPHLALLLKSTQPRDRDTLDFRSALPQLDPELRAWLSDAITLAAAGHPWLGAITAPGR
ncbi:MAG TPA: hypothetical protein PLD59_05485 [Tepidisphaeraceae bacterium]|nr:hypothetical protein [Tepidisphaeraceae bacterium]